MSQTLGETMMASFMASTKEIPDIFIGPPGGYLERSGELPPGGPWLSIRHTISPLF